MRLECIQQQVGLSGHYVGLLHELGHRHHKTTQSAYHAEFA